jgi:fructose-1,6-bisphosphatase I
MASEISLDQYLASSAKQAGMHEDLASILRVIASTGAEFAKTISRQGLVPHALGAVGTNTDGDIQKPLDIRSHNLFVEALGKLPITFIASEESDELIEIDAGATLAVAIDPLDGSSNIETNTSIGTVFSVLTADTVSVFDKPLGDIQKAAGFLFYGPQTRLILTCGDGTQSFVLDREDDRFYLVNAALEIPAGQREFAINTSNYRFWDDSVRYFIDDCIAGESGPLGEDFNMRWNASLVAEAYRILVRGGVFLYPGDSRPSYESGRLRLLYEALPLAFIIEQSGGQASDGIQRILEMKLASLHKRVPLIFGSRDRVREIIEYITGEAVENTRFPLFEKRSLFRN